MRALVVRPGRIALLVSAAVLVGGCGSTTPVADGPDVPITARGIAAIALDHLPGDTTKREPTFVNDRMAKGTIGADLRYKGDGEDDGDLIRVTVQPATGEPTCPPRNRCARLADGVLLAWELVVPEEDPGFVTLSVRNGDSQVGVLLAGPDISADPRTLDLRPSVDLLTELVRDSRLRLQTAPAVEAAGSDLGHWSD